MPNLAEHLPRRYAAPGYGEIVCHCELVTRAEIEAALSGPLPAGDLGGLKRRTRAMMGRCQGFYCSAQVAALADGRLADFPMAPSHEAIEVVISGRRAGGSFCAARLAELGIRDIVLIEREGRWAACRAIAAIPPSACANFTGCSSGPAYARRLAAAVAGIGVRSRTTVTAIEPGRRGRYPRSRERAEPAAGRAVLLAFGVRETPRSARLVSGDRPWGVTTTGALQQFVYLQKHPQAVPQRRSSSAASSSPSPLCSPCAMAGSRRSAMIEAGAAHHGAKPGRWAGAPGCSACRC